MSPSNRLPPLPKSAFWGQSGHDKLYRTALRSFRRHAFLRSRWRAPETTLRYPALAVRPRPATREMAGMGAEPLFRYAAAARHRQRRAAIVRRSRQLAYPDLGAEHPGGSGVVDARL